MHVDGGTTQQVMFFNPAFPLRRVDEELGVPFERTLDVIVNNQLRKPYQPVEPRLLDIARTATNSLIGGAGGSDLYKLFTIARRDRVDFRLLSVPGDFDHEATEPMDPVYMRALYEVGYRMGLAGDRWLDRPPDFAS